MGASCCKDGDSVQAQPQLPGGSSSSSSNNRGGGHVGSSSSISSTSAATTAPEMVRRNHGQPRISWKPQWKSETPLTMGQVLSKRDEFWDTSPAFGGRHEIWQALRTACETDDPEFAETIVKAANINLPFGNLTMAYDELGNQYEIPPFCLSFPVNTISGGEPNINSSVAGENSDQGGHRGSFGRDSPTLSTTTTAAATTTQPVGLSSESGSNGGEETSIRIKLVSGEEMAWAGPVDSSISQLKQFIEQKHGISPERMKVLYAGKLLTDATTLRTASVHRDTVVQVMVRPADV